MNLNFEREKCYWVRGEGAITLLTPMDPPLRSASSIGVFVSFRLHCQLLIRLIKWGLAKMFHIRLFSRISQKA